MKIKVDNVEVLNVSETQMKVLADQIPSTILEDDLKRRVHYIITHKYERCLENLKAQWIPLLKQRGVQSIPLNDEAFAQLVFEQPDYKDRVKRDQEKEARDRKEVTP